MRIAVSGASGKGGGEGPRLLAVEGTAPRLAVRNAARGEGYSYVDETLEQARASHARYGAARPSGRGRASTYTTAASGQLDAISDNIQGATRPQADSRTLIGAIDHRLRSSRCIKHAS